MKKNDVFTFIAPNGVEVTGICLYPISKGTMANLYLCYAQNRLFTMLEESIMTDKGIKTTIHYHKVIVDYAILPDYDELLARYNDIEVAQAETASGM